MTSRVPSVFPLTRRVRIITSFSSSVPNRVISASSRLCWLRIVRRRSVSGFSRNCRVSCVPPAKSTPTFRLPWKKTAKTPIPTRTRETMIQNFRYFMKSMLVSRSNSIACSFESALGALDRQLLDAEPGEDQVEHPAADEDRGEHRGQQADGQGDGKAADRAGAELEQEEGRDQGRDVAVDDGGQRLLEAEIDRGADRPPCVQLLADALEDEHVGNDRHTDGQDDAGDAGQGERRIERRQAAEQQDDVQDQGEDRIEAAQVVDDQHVEDDER